MNIRLVFKTTGRALLVEGACILLSLLVCLLYREDPVPFLLTLIILLLVAVPMACIRTKLSVFTPRSGLVCVAVIWVTMSLLGALPFFFCGGFGNLVDCIFESVSGFTTTGASILTQIEGLPYGILFWRSFTHWLGGMGVLVLTLAIFPSVGSGTNNLMFNESPGPTSERLLPTIAGSAKSLYLIYIALTVLHIIALVLCGLDLYNSAVTAFGSAGTGGFSVMNASIAGYANPAVEVVVTIFMLLFGTNFAIFFLSLTGQWRRALRSTELWFYYGIVAVSIILITLDILRLYPSVGEALRLSAFQVASIITTTGYATADFDLWPTLSKMLLVILMLVGACAGSTGGGIKCARAIILLKALLREAGRMLHPQSVRRLHMDGRNVSESTITSITYFFFAYILTLFLGSVLVSLDNLGFQDTFTGVLACVSNIGPGLGIVGPAGNYSVFSELSKLVLSLCMLIGRLEIFPILILFHPSTWKHI